MNFVLIAIMIGNYCDFHEGQHYCVALFLAQASP